MIEGDDGGKKALIGVSLAVLAAVGVVGGKVYMNNNDNKIENIVKSDEAKQTIEEMLKKLDSKALTSEGKIKTYKIDESYTHKNPMGGLTVRVIINDDPELDVETTLNKYPSRGKLEHGVILRSQKMAKLVPPKGKLNAESNKGNE